MTKKLKYIEIYIYTLIKHIQTQFAIHLKPK